MKPNLFLIGAPKAGTSAIADYLGQHPDIFLSSLKEPRYFDAHIFYDYKQDYPIKTEKEYLSLFSSLNAKSVMYRLDASVFNMYSNISIERIISFEPSSKFILVLRDPVQAFLSMFNQRMKNTNSNMREVSHDIVKCWNLLESRKKGKGFPKGCRNTFLFRYDLLFSYEKYVPMLKETISPQNLKIIFYEDFKKNPKAISSDLFNYLKVDECFEPEQKYVNESFQYEIKYKCIHKFLEFVADLTRETRQKVGFPGFPGYKKLTVQKVSSVKNLPVSLEEEVRSYFSKTIEYMEKLQQETQFKTKDTSSG